MAANPARVVAAVKRAQARNEVRKGIPPAVAQYQQMVYGHSAGVPLPRDPMQFLAGTFTPLTPIEPVPVNVPEGDTERPMLRQREMPVGWNMPIGVPGSEGFKLASFGTLRMYADIYSVARSCIQLRKNEIRGLEWDVMPTPAAEKKMRGDAAAHRDFAERRDVVIKFFRKPDPDYLSFGSYIDAVTEEMLVTDALSLYIHPTRKSGKGPFGSDVAALELISGSTIRPLVNTRGGRVRAPSPGYQQYLYGVPRSDLMEIINGTEADEVKELGQPVKTYRGDQLLYLPYTQRAWTPYGFPPLERTLIPTITGLRKQQFQMDFFDEGTIPGNYISPGENLGWTPNQLQIWQDQQNALAGDPAWKHKSIALPPGSKVFPMKPITIADQADEVIMTQICMGYDVEPMELGISPKVSATQSPGAANQMAKASQDKQQRKSTKPTLAFFTDIFNVIIQVLWGQADMRFMFEGLEEDEDENALVERLVQMIQYGLCPIDEARIALGKPPYGLPITSDPVFVSPTAGLVPLGSIDPTTGKPMGTPPPAAIGAPPPPGGGAPPGVGGPPGRPALPPGAPGPAETAKPSGGPPKPGKTPPGTQSEPPDPTKPQKPVGPHPDDKVGTARQAAQEAHAGIQQQMHEDFAAGKPLEPPVRPPVASEETSQPSSKAMLSELDALRRHVKKGRAPAMWEVRHLPGLIVEHYTGLLKLLSPDDAHAVTREFVIQCFGPPVLQAQIEKVIDTASPLDASGGKQGLVPYDLAGEQPLQQSYPECPDCGQRHDPDEHDRMPRGDNGAVAVAPGQVRKGDAGPKVPGLATRAWPAWRYDLQVKAHYASQLASALDGQSATLAGDWLQSRGVSKGVPGPGSQQAWSWLASRGIDQWLRRQLARVLNGLWAEGFAVGRESAREMLDPAYSSSFWNEWVPGDEAAARLAAGPGLQQLLSDYGIQTIKSVANSRMNDLADALSEGFSNGDSAEQIAADISDILISPQRALMIAGTELARATTQASMAEYLLAGRTGKQWAYTPDRRACPRCKDNAAQGVIPIGQAFSSGASATPGHPECRCATLPGMVPASQSGLFSLSSLKGAARELAMEYLSSGLSWSDVRQHLLKDHPHYTREQVHLRPASSHSRSCVTCAMWTATPHEDDPPAGRCDFGFFSEADDVCDKWAAKDIVKQETKKDDVPLSTDGFVAGGLAIRAKDTGRVLMIQRAYDGDDPAGGMWEFPGGRPEPGESVLDAARREWAEETGLDVPAGSVAGIWDHAGYRGHVLPVESESVVDLLDRSIENPDDPDGEHPEAIAWWNPAELKDNPAVRDELRKHPKRVRRALESTGDGIDKTASDYYEPMIQKAADQASTGEQVYQQLLQNYPPDSIEWVRRATWEGPADVPWDKIDHDDMDSWAASHQPQRVDHFADRIEAGDPPNPVVLVRDADGTWIDVDGHHRAMAYHKLGRPIRAWVGTIDPADRHAMEETHLDQVHEGADPRNG